MSQADQIRSHLLLLTSHLLLQQSITSHRSETRSPKASQSTPHPAPGSCGTPSLPKHVRERKQGPRIADSSRLRDPLVGPQLTRSCDLTSRTARLRISLRASAGT